MDPTYSLPPGFVKYPKEQMIETYKPMGLIDEGAQIATMILDDVYLGLFGNHYLHPEVSY
jgi:hypothetical protein